ncbi:hypothetical protein JW899_04710 [Candidatus Uhrbacteria bacterium]|nr:hypothetical protein [Candidatus Uhrbacteria bacterium]
MGFFDKFRQANAERTKTEMGMKNFFWFFVVMIPVILISCVGNVSTLPPKFRSMSYENLKDLGVKAKPHEKFSFSTSNLEVEIKKYLVPTDENTENKETITFVVVTATEIPYNSMAMAKWYLEQKQKVALSRRSKIVWIDGALGFLDIRTAIAAETIKDPILIGMLPKDIGAFLKNLVLSSPNKAAKVAAAVKAVGEIVDTGVNSSEKIRREIEEIKK